MASARSRVARSRRWTSACARSSAAQHAWCPAALASISAGGVVLREFWRFPSLMRVLGFSVGALLCFGGVALITRRPRGSRPAGAHAPSALADALDTGEAARDRLMRAVRRVAEANRFAQLVSAQLDVALVGGADPSVTQDPPVAAVTGVGTMLQIHRAASVGAVLPITRAPGLASAPGASGELAAGLLEQQGAEGSPTHRALAPTQPQEQPVAR